MSEGPPPGEGEPPAFHLGAGGMTIAWREQLGVAFARYSAWSREQPDEAGFLDSVESVITGGPAISPTRRAPRVAYADQRGAHAMEVGPDASGRARLLPDGVGAVALSDERLFAETEEGLASLGLSGERGAERLEHERDRAGPALLAAVQLRGESVLVHCAEGAEAFRVLCVRPGGVEAVVHRVRRPIHSLHLSAAGPRAALALGLAAGSVRVGILGAGGRVIERPHEVFPTAVGALESPRVVWMEQGFAVLARARDTGQLHVRPLGDRGQGFTLPEVGAAYSVAYRAERLYAVEVLRHPEGRRLALWRCHRSGREQQRRLSELDLDPSGARRSWREASHLVGAVARRLEVASDYRERGRIVTTSGPARLSLDAGETTLHIAIEPWERGFRLELVWGDARLRPVRSPFERVAGWLARLRPSAREAHAQTLGWAREALQGLPGASLEAAVAEPGEGRALAATLRELPGVGPLERWLRKLAAAPR